MTEDITGKRAWILGLSVKCPHSDPEHDCIIGKLRGVSFTEAYRVLEELPVPELEELLQCHKNCLAEREQELPSHSGDTETSKE